MRAHSFRAESGDGRSWTVAAIVGLQSLAAAFFVADAAGDLQRDGLSAHIAVEAPVAVSLLAGIAFGAWRLRTMLADARRRDAALAAASGALGEVIRAHFAQWGLTAAEADVALFALKGCDVAEIARLRSTAAGTVRAQLARAYAKAGVGSRAALVSLFIEDLLSGVPAPQRSARLDQHQAK
ncbi:hypothetical protein M529_21730 [Sphingobium ummariense RL-3]|uniref:HTH luxR-type domain-containing protein n=1 Tax=Sphingobium ummariense RL-3 TaxID=1346791 RepID=T0IZW6_9SPHN|nr:hypothetical protein M529_21730 [Sphingobium ummariense RL-3]